MMSRWSRTRPSLVSAAALSVALAGAPPAAAQRPQIVTLDAPSPLIEVRIMARAGSAHDPEGLEGLAALTARALLQAGYGDAARPVTKEKLAQITRPWGAAALPEVRAAKEATTFSMTIPRDVLDAYLEQVLRPLFTRPLFLENEIDRLRNEAITNVSSSLRYENIEVVGLQALDNYVHAGTSYGHTVSGSVQGLRAITPADVQAFYATYYRPDNMIIGVSTTDRASIRKIRDALSGVGRLDGDVGRVPTPELEAPPPVDGRGLVVVGMPDAGATGIHAAFPLPINRADPDFWPLYVANVYFGTHRDSHSHLYKRIRQARGYNYGDYSYIEHFAGRPFNLFPPFNTPRQFQYFSIWVRPVGTEYAHHLLKAASWELEDLIRAGISKRDFELSVNKAKALYLNLAENSSRLLAAKVDDAFYGMEPGYLEGYLDRIDALTREQVDAAIRKYLGSREVKFLIVTEADGADALAAGIAAGGTVYGKSPTDYRIDADTTGGRTFYRVPEEKLDILRLDAVWAHHPLRLTAERVRVVPVEALFETGDFITETAASQRNSEAAGTRGPAR